MKVCCTCKLEKSETIFCKNKNTEDGLSAQCKDCAKAYRDSHKEEKKTYPTSNKEYRTDYRDNNKTHINELRKLARKKNPEPYKKTAKKSYLKHRDKRIKKMQATYQENKKDYAKRNKQYREANKDAILLNNRRRTEHLQQWSRITQEQVNCLLLEHNYQCLYCKIEVKRGINLHLDHKIPLSRGGSHTIDNLAPSCATCNMKKGMKTDIEYFIILTSENK